MSREQASIEYAVGSGRLSSAARSLANFHTREQFRLQRERELFREEMSRRQTVGESVVDLKQALEENRVEQKALDDGWEHSSLRRHIESRAEKKERLYAFITSEGFRRRVGEAERLVGQVLELDVDEKRVHDNVWKKRGTMASQLRRVLGDLDGEVNAILEGTGR